MALEDILGMNARNFSYIREYNSRDVIRLVDNKLKTKKLLREANLPVPETYKIFRNSFQVRDFDFFTLPNSFVVKPNSGFGGKGILVVYGKTKNGFLRSDGGLITFDEIKLHILDILEGVYSLSGLPDLAYIEERVKSDKGLKRFSFRGLPDIRVITFNMVPVMAMLRLPTHESRGRSNLHEGALGVGIDLNTGITLDGFNGHKRSEYLPNTKIKLRGKKIKHWDEILLLSSEVQNIVGGKFLGVDIAIKENGEPVILELNARPGLSIQNVNCSGLKDRLNLLEKLKISNASRAIKLGKELFKKEYSVDEEAAAGEIGLVEVVDFFGPNKSKIKVLSKIDTGAYYGSIDFNLARELGLNDLVDRAIKLKNTDPKFVDLLISEIKKDNRVIDILKIKSSLGQDYRIIFNLHFRIGGMNLESKFSLADRSHMTYQAILGKFNIKKFVLDPLKYSNKFAPFQINHLNDARPYFAISAPQVIGVGVNAFNRLGLGKMNDYYVVAALQNNDEDMLLNDQIKQIFSLEKQGVDLNNLKLNSQSLLRHKLFSNFLQNFKRRIFLLTYESSESIERLAKKLNVNIIGNSARLYKKLADKNNFRIIAKKLDLPIVKSQLLRLPFNFEKVAQNLGEKLFVQLKNAGGGKGNFIINNQQDVDELSQKYLHDEVIVSRFIDGYSPSITGCVTKYGVFYLPPQMQILDQDILVASERGTGQFCGHDFNTDLISENIKKQAYISVEKIGNYLKKIGYKGIFGLDFLWDGKNKKLFVVECNPRLLGVHPTQTLIQLANNEIPLILWHTLEFLNATYKVDYKKIQNQYLNHKINGSHLIINNLEQNKCIFKPNLKAGTYSFDGQQIKFERAEHDFAGLGKNEFILTDGIPENQRSVRVWMRLCRIITRETVLDSDLKTLNPWAQNLIRKLRNNFNS